MAGRVGSNGRLARVEEGIEYLKAGQGRLEDKMDRFGEMAVETKTKVGSLETQVKRDSYIDKIAAAVVGVLAVFGIVVKH